VTAPTDEQLLAAHLDGDAHAFRTLVDRHVRELYQFVHRFVRSNNAADDVVQEAFVQLHLSAAGFDPQRRLKPWLFTIAANKARDYLRSRGRKREVPLDATLDRVEDAGQRFVDLLASEVDAPDMGLEESERQTLVRRVVDQMPEHLATVLILAYFHSFPYKEIAEILDIPLGTVKSRLHAAVAYFGNAYRSQVAQADDAQA